jgi:hypothetical protein
MNRGSIALAALLVLASGHFASAGLSLELIDRGVPTNGTISATGYTGYTLRLNSDMGRISGIDLSSNEYGIFGPLVQRWISLGDEGVYDTPTPGFLAAQNLSPSAVNFDSHLLPIPPSLVIVQPTEDASIGPVGSQLGPFPANSLSAGIGQGSRLGTAFGIIGAANVTSMDLAYLVIPDSGTIDAYATVAIGGSPPQVVELTSARLGRHESNLELRCVEHKLATLWKRGGVPSRRRRSVWR